MPNDRLISIGEVLRDAQLGDLRVLMERREPFGLASAAARLLELLDERSVAYVLVGGIAMLQYVTGRNTRDIDLIMAPADLLKLPEIAITTRDRDFARGNFDGVQLDLLLVTNPVFDLVRSRHTALRPFAERPVTCATPSGLFLLKLFALPSLYRQGETDRVTIYEADLRMLMDGYPLDTETLLAELTPHVLASDIAELRSILSDIASKPRRFD